MDYKNTLNLPRTDFPMKADLVTREPERLKKWESTGLYQRLQQARDLAPSLRRAQRLLDRGLAHPPRLPTPIEVAVGAAAVVAVLRSRAERMFHNEQSAIVCVACAPSNHRKTPTHQRYPFGNVTPFMADIRVGADVCIAPVMGMNSDGPTSELDGRGRKVGVN